MSRPGRVGRMRPPGALLDRSAGFVTSGCRFLPGLRRRSFDGTAAIRLAGRRAVVAAGAEAARDFYAGDAFCRAGALPGPLQATLFGRGAVHGLDGAEHRHRKQLLVTALSAERVVALADRVDHEWDAAVRRWENRDRVVVFDEAVRVLARGVLDWAGAVGPGLPARCGGTAGGMDVDPVPHPSDELADEVVLHELEQLYRTRLDTLRRGSDAALENSDRRIRELEAVYLRRRPQREVSARRLRPDESSLFPPPSS